MRLAGSGWEELSSQMSAHGFHRSQRMAELTASAEYCPVAAEYPEALASAMDALSLPSKMPSMRAPATAVDAG